MKILIGFSCIVFIPSLVCGGEFTRLLPNGSAVVISINVRHILKSPLLQQHTKLGNLPALLDGDEKQIQNIAKATKLKPAHIHELRRFVKESLKRLAIDVDAVGLDVFKDIDRISYAVAENDDPMNGLVVIEGRFKSGKFTVEALKKAAVKPKQFKVNLIHGVGVLETYSADGAAKPMRYSALLKRKILLVTGNKVRLAAALKLAADAKATGLPASFSAHMNQADVEAFTCVIRTDSMPAAGQQLLANVPAVGFGISLRDDCTIRAGLTAKTAAQAKKLRFQIDQGITGLALLLNQSQDPTLRALMDALLDLRVRSRGRAVSIHGSIEAETIGRVFGKIGAWNSD